MQFSVQVLVLSLKAFVLFWSAIEIMLMHSVRVWIVWVWDVVEGSLTTG